MLARRFAPKRCLYSVGTRCLSQTAIRMSAPKWEEWRLGVPVAASEDSPMLAHQSSLPKFPVPELGDTVARALRTCEPLATDAAEYHALERKAREFVQGEGSKLQSVLQDRTEKTRNWLAEWWDTNAYMAYRDSVVSNVSYFYGFSKLPQGPNKDYSKDNPAFVAASLALSSIAFRDQITQGSLVPDEAGGVKLDMDHYKWMFNACRIPAKPIDYARKIRESDPAGDHFTVVRRNRFYKVPINGTDGKRLGLAALEKVIQGIYDSAGDAVTPVGALSSADRDLWSEAREHLLASGSKKNAYALEQLETSIFCLCLDDKKPTTDPKNPQAMEAFSRELWHGDGNNRFWDKPVQWVVFDSGEAGIIGEHSCMDGTPTARMSNGITLDLMEGKLPQEPNEVSTGLPKAEELPFDVDSKTQQFIDKALADLQVTIKQNKMNYLLFDKYGKDQIKAQKTGPDSWVQMVMQLAYYITYGQSVATYEAAAVRRFDLGRTETVRVTSKETLAFVKSMLDPTKSNGERKELFKQAVAQHGKVMKNAMTGNGVDRHIFGLKCAVAEGQPIPAFLEDPLLKRSGYWIMSTSQIFGQHFIGYGWGAVVPEGHGFAYLIRDKNLQFTVSSKISQPNEKLVENIEKAADALMALIRDDQAPNLKAKL